MSTPWERKLFAVAITPSIPFANAFETLEKSNVRELAGPLSRQSRIAAAKCGNIPVEI